MDIDMGTITLCKVVIGLVTLAACGGLLYKSRVSASKVVFGLGLTFYALVSLAVTPADKRIRRIQADLAMIPMEDEANRARVQASLDGAIAARNRAFQPNGSLAERLSPVGLGLDLRGGTEVGLRLTTNTELLQAYEKERVDLETRLRQQRAASAPADEIATLEDAIKKKTEEINSEAEALRNDITGAVGIIRERLNSSGLAEIPVTTQGDNRVIIQLPGMTTEEADYIIETIRRQGLLEFRIVADTSANALITKIQNQNPAWIEDVHNVYLQDGEIGIAQPSQIDAATGQLLVDGAPTGPQVYDWLGAPTEFDSITKQRKPPVFELVQKKVELRGDTVRQASFEPDVQRNSYRILMGFNHEGARTFEKVSANNLKRQLAIVLDGKLQSAPVLQSVINTGRAEITGNFTRSQANQLSTVLKSGSLRANINQEYINNVGATLGDDSIRSGIQALIIGFVGVVLVMLVYYMAAGLVSDVLLVVNILFILACLAGLDATMTLPGLAGLVLTLGMNVDANVLIFERVREEREKGNPLARALHLGYSRAFVTIVDANLTTLITALILHSFGTETVKGFAMTLMVGILTGMFCSIVMTRWVLDFLIDRRWITELKMLKLFNRTHLNILGARRFVFTLSAAAVIVGMSLFLWRGNENLGQDLVGGTLVEIQTKRPYDLDEAREALRAKDPERRFSDAPDSMQARGVGVVDPADGLTRHTSFSIRSKYVEANPLALAERKAKNPDLPMFGEDEFRETIEKAFELVDRGLIVNPTRMDDQAPAGETAYEVHLSTVAPVAPRTLAVHTVIHEGIMPLWIGTGDDALPDVTGTTVTLQAQVPAATPPSDADVRAQVAAAVAAMGFEPLRVDDPANLRIAFGAAGSGENPTQALTVSMDAARPVAQTEIATALQGKDAAVPAWTNARWVVEPSVTSVEALVQCDFLPTNSQTGVAYTARTVLDALIEQLRPLAGPDGLFPADVLSEARLGDAAKGAGGPDALWWLVTQRRSPMPGWRVDLVLPLNGHRTQEQLDAAFAAAKVKSDRLRVFRMPLYAHPEKANTPTSNAHALVSLNLRDEFGRTRPDAILYKSVRDLFQGLQRMTDDIEFTDPMPRFTSVGASVADEMAANSLLAIIYSLVAIFAYIWLRFQFRLSFSLAAVIGLAHDVAIALGALAFVDHFHLMNGQIDLTVVAALLTVVGYSLNNTIVIFDRIREHLHDAHKPVGDLVNRAVNETLSRTVITSTTTLWVVLALFVWGGDVIRGFAFTLFVGVAVGTYSSIFLVGPLLTWFSKLGEARDRRKLLGTAARPATTRK